MTFSLQTHRENTIARQRRLYGPTPIERWRENVEMQRAAEQEAREQQRVDAACLREQVSALQEENATLRWRHPARVVRDAIARAYGFSPEDLQSQRREGPLVYARQTAMAHVLHQTGLSLPAVGRLFGNRDHTTVLHAKRKFDADIAAAAAKVGARFRQIEAGKVAIAAPYADAPARVWQVPVAPALNKQRTLILEMFREGLDTVDIAAQLGIKESDAANALAAARRGLA